MSRNGSGVYTFPSSEFNPAVSGATLTSASWNTLRADIETAMSASIASDGQTVCSAYIPFAAGVTSKLGSVSSVGYGFTSDTNTGLYSPAADQAALACGGVQIFAATSSSFTVAKAATFSTAVTFSGALNAATAAITGGSVSGITDLAVADGGTGASTAAGARTNLGLGTAAVLAECTSAEYRNNTADRALSTDQVWGAAAEVTLTDGASIAVDLDSGINFTVTLGGNRALANPTNEKVGQTGYIRVVQDATGSRTLSFGTDYEFAGGTAPTLTTTANAEDMLFYCVIATNRVLVTSVLDIS